MCLTRPYDESKNLSITVKNLKTFTLTPYSRICHLGQKPLGAPGSQMENLKLKLILLFLSLRNLTAIVRLDNATRSILQNRANKCFNGQNNPLLPTHPPPLKKENYFVRKFMVCLSFSRFARVSYFAVFVYIRNL